MAESKEYTTIVNLKSQLEIALRTDRRVANHLHKEGLITNDVLKDTMANQSDSERAGLLVTEILKIVEKDPKNYYKLLNSLCHWGRQYTAIYEAINKEYLKVESPEETVPKSKPTPTVFTSSSLPDSGMVYLANSFITNSFHKTYMTYED